MASTNRGPSVVSTVFRPTVALRNQNLPAPLAVSRWPAAFS